MNKALQELENLNNLRGDVQDAQANLAKLQDTRREFSARDQGEAGFATPEALATAVGAGFILGPVGGLILGAAQGILGKQEKQSLLDQWNADNEALAAADQVFNDQFDRLAMSATNNNDVEQLSAYQAQKDAGIKLMQAGNPELQAKGQAMFEAAMTGLNEYTVRQEEQRIEGEVRDAQIARDLAVEQRGTFKSMLDDYDAQSANYKETVQQANLALEAIQRGNPVDITAALIAVNKSLDPTSVVRPEEARALVAGGDLLEQARRKVNEWAGSGLPLGEQDRKDLMTLVQGITNNARGFQMQRDIEFQERAVTLELPTQYVQHFRLVDDLPAFTPGQLRTRQGAFEQADQAATQSIQQTLQGIFNMDGGYNPGNRTGGASRKARRDQRAN